MYRPVSSPQPYRYPKPAVSHKAVERLLAERDSLAQDRQTLIEEVQRLRGALAEVHERWTEQELVSAEPTGGVAAAEPSAREQELLGDIATLRRNTAVQVEQAVSAERSRLLSVVADTYDDVARAAEPLRTAELAPVLRAFDDRLTSLGVSRVGRVGQQFDPTQFEAVALDETRPHGEVVAVVSTGLQDEQGRLLRPAKVVVGAQS